MNTTKAINRLAENDLRFGVQSNASWHNDYADSAYIFIANLNYDMSEGDIAIVFSQFGEPVDVHLVRNKKTGASRGFCFLAYEDQRSAVVAVDNINGAEVCGRTVRVDHVKQFKPPREFLEVKQDDPDFFDKLYKPSGPDGKGWGDFRKLTKEEVQLAEREAQLEREQEELNEKILQNMEETQKQKYFMDADERWEKMLMEQEENENEILKKKIQELEEYNKKIIKIKEPKKRIQQETNAERLKRLEGQKKISKDKKKHKK